MLARLVWLLGVCCLVACTASARSPLPRATMLMDKGRSEEASVILRDYLRKNPSAVPERRLLIRVEAFRGQLGAAEAEAKALERQLGPTSPIPMVELGH